jgi:hypothetical protein
MIVAFPKRTMQHEDMPIGDAEDSPLKRAPR